MSYDIHGFGRSFMPDYYPRQIARLVSCYALLNEWLLPRQHPSCLCDPTSLVQLTDHLGALAGGLDSSPLGHGP